MSEPVFDRENLVLAVEAIRKRVRICRDYDIPFVAGYSTDGKTIYLDRDLPETILVGGRAWNAHLYVIAHEATEKALIDQYGLTYRQAHAIAGHVDRARVQLDDLDIQAYVDHLGGAYKGNRLDLVRSIPADLDWTPYHHSAAPELLAHMQTLDATR